MSVLSLWPISGCNACSSVRRADPDERDVEQIADGVGVDDEVMTADRVEAFRMAPPPPVMKAGMPALLNA